MRLGKRFYILDIVVVIVRVNGEMRAAAAASVYLWRDGDEGLVGGRRWADGGAIFRDRQFN